MKYVPFYLQYKDLLQHMIEASVESGSGSGCGNKIAVHSVMFMMAGYETTANALTYVSYLLALHPDIQENLQVEIDNYYDNNPVSVSRSYSCIVYIFFYCSAFIQNGSPYQASADLDYFDTGHMGIPWSLPSCSQITHFNISCLYMF